MDALDRQWLPWKGTGFYKKSLVAKERFGNHGMSMADM
jgi:hypothetical protein